LHNPLNVAAATRNPIMEALAEIRSLIARHAVPGNPGTALGGLRLRVADTPTTPVSGFYQPAFSFVAQGAKQTVLGQRIYQMPVGICQ